MSHDNFGFEPRRESVSEKSQESIGSVENIENAIPKFRVFSVDEEDYRRRSKKLDVAYNPYDHRQVEHPTSNSDTLIHLLKGSLGTGILAMPQAFSYSGYLVGIIATIFIGFLATYCIQILIKCSYELCKRRRVPSMTYQATAEAALLDGPEFLRPFASASAHVINIFLLTYQLGTCCVYTVFIAENLKSAIEFYITPVPLEYYMLALLLPLILINWIGNLKYLAPLSTLANAITFISFGIMLYFIFQVKPSIDGRVAVGTIDKFPLFFGTVLFALEAIGVILPLENEMKKPKKFGGPCGILNIGMFIIVFLYTAMGFFGYIRYGPEVNGSVTLNLPNEPLAKIVQILLALSIYMSHSLQCYVAIDILWNIYISKRVKKSNKFWAEYSLRTGIVVGTLCLAMAVPRLDLFISLFGALCLSALGLAFPAFIETCTFWSIQGNTQNALMLLKNGFIVIFGLLGLVAGTYTSLSSIIKSFS